jgi:hypothetical protein
LRGVLAKVFRRLPSGLLGRLFVRPLRGLLSGRKEGLLAWLLRRFLAKGCRLLSWLF